MPSPIFGLGMKESILKIVAVLLIVGLSWGNLSLIGQTFAYFFDDEDAPANNFSAATLDFSLHSIADFSPEVSPTQDTQRDVNVTNDGILGFNYVVGAANFNGILCDYLNIEANLDGNAVEYTGLLKDFNFDAGQFSDPESWQLAASLTSNDPNLENQTRAFDLVFDGVQLEGPGFSDQEIISNTITTGQWTEHLTCVEAKAAGLISGSISGGNGTVVNNSDYSFLVGLASYKEYNSIIDDQTIFDSEAVTVGAHQTVNLTVDRPECRYQIDLFCGEVLQSLDGQRYGNRKFDAEERGSPYCTPPQQDPYSCMKVNEVYYDVDSSHGQDSNHEWIELYNACTWKVNLKNWSLRDNTSQEVIGSNYYVNPGQYVVVTADASVWNTYWTAIPVNAVKIALGGNNMFNGLSNSGDKVALYNRIGSQTDCVSWGSNGDCGFSVPDVDEGHSISRKTAGVDTDTADDWMDTYAGSVPPGPNPGTNPHGDYEINLVLQDLDLPDTLIEEDAPAPIEEPPVQLVEEGLIMGSGGAQEPPVVEAEQPVIEEQSTEIVEEVADELPVSEEAQPTVEEIQPVEITEEVLQEPPVVEPEQPVAEEQPIVEEIQLVVEEDSLPAVEEQPASLPQEDETLPDDSNAAGGDDPEPEDAASENNIEATTEPTPDEII